MDLEVEGQSLQTQRIPEKSDEGATTFNRIINKYNRSNNKKNNMTKKASSSLKINRCEFFSAYEYLWIVRSLQQPGRGPSRIHWWWPNLTWKNRHVWTQIPPHIEKFGQLREFQSANLCQLQTRSCSRSGPFQVPKQAIKTPVAEENHSGQILTVHVLLHGTTVCFQLGTCSLELHLRWWILVERERLPICKFRSCGVPRIM